MKARMEPHRQQPRKAGAGGGEATSQARVKAGHAVVGLETTAYKQAAKPAPSDPVLTAEEETIARRFLAEGGGKAKTRLHKKMQSGF